MARTTLLSRKFSFTLQLSLLLLIACLAMYVRAQGEENSETEADEVPTDEDKAITDEEIRDGAAQVEEKTDDFTNGKSITNDPFRVSE